MMSLNNFIAACSIVLAICAVVPANARADYDPTHLFEMAATSDLIATGEIVEVRERTYVLKIDNVLVGKRRDTFEIGRFFDWPCASRWAKYEKGERILLFAVEHDGKSQSRGAACEGESPIVKSYVYCNFPSWLKPQEKFGKPTMPKVAYQDLRAAILEYRTCFRVRIAKGRIGEIAAIDTLISDRALTGFSARSEVHGFLAESTHQAQARLLDSSRGR